MQDDDLQRDGAGERLGRYVLVRRLGKGGMGEVFLAKTQGVRGFEKHVAIKRILPQYSQNNHVVNMLVDEARISVLLNHPNVVQVMELDESDGSHFIVMEYVDGHALSRLVRRLKKRGERFDPLLAAYVVIQVLDGLHAAHTQRDASGELAGIIHRDVSPQNVLLSMTGQVKVIDFGIARARDRLEATQGSQVKGKLRYMAPEQIKPSLAGSGGIDHRVDVFAAGIMLFELLAMRQRFPQRHICARCAPAVPANASTKLRLSYCMRFVTAAHKALPTTASLLRAPMPASCITVPVLPSCNPGIYV